MWRKECISFSIKLINSLREKISNYRYSTKRVRRGCKAGQIVHLIQFDVVVTSIDESIEHFIAIGNNPLQCLTFITHISSPSSHTTRYTIASYGNNNYLTKTDNMLTIPPVNADKCGCHEFEVCVKEGKSILKMA